MKLRFVPAALAAVAFGLAGCTVNEDADPDGTTVVNPPASSPDVHVTTPPASGPDVHINNNPPPTSGGG